MSSVSRRKLIHGLGGVLGSSFLQTNAWARPKYSDCAVKIDVPASLTLGTMRTPAFPVKHKIYRIILLVKAPTAPIWDVACLLGTDWSSLGKKCNVEPLLAGNWIVWDGAIKVDEGSFSGGGGNGEAPEERELGHFTGQNKKNYVLEMTFTRDGGLLKSMAPHLLVRQNYDFRCEPM